MDSLILYYLGSLTAIGLVMEIIVKIDNGMDSWSLATKFIVFGFEITILQVIGAVLSLGASIVLTWQAGYYWTYAIAGFVAIYFSQYGAGKLGWRKVFQIIITVSKWFSVK